MRLIFAAIFATILTACGGGGDENPTPFMPDVSAAAQPIAQCSGTPKTAVVYAGAREYPELALIPDACVYTVNPSTMSDLKATMDRAMVAVGRSAIHLIASDAAAGVALAYMSAEPGHVAVASLWFAPYTDGLSGLSGSIASLYLNDTTQAACQKQAEATPQYVPDRCQMWPDKTFDAPRRVVGIGQLALQLVD